MKLVNGRRRWHLRPIQIEMRRIFGRGIELAAGGLIALRVEQLVGHADFHVVGFAREDLRATCSVPSSRSG